MALDALQAAEHDQNASHVLVHKARAAYLEAKAQLVRAKVDANNVEGMRRALAEARIALLMTKASEQRAMAAYDELRDELYNGMRERRRSRRRRVSTTRKVK